MQNSRAFVITGSLRLVVAPIETFLQGLTDPGLSNSRILVFILNFQLSGFTDYASRRLSDLRAEI